MQAWCPWSTREAVVRATGKRHREESSSANEEALEGDGSWQSWEPGAPTVRLVRQQIAERVAREAADTEHPAGAGSVLRQKAVAALFCGC